MPGYAHLLIGGTEHHLEIYRRSLAAADVAVILLRELLTDALSRPGGWTAKTLDSSLLAALVTRRDTGGTDVAASSKTGDR
jgi:hypothetical protein